MSVSLFTGCVHPHNESFHRGLSSDIVACFAVSFALRLPSIPRLIMTLLAFIARGRLHALEFCCAIFLLAERLPLNAFTPAAALPYRFLGWCSRLFIVGLLFALYWDAHVDCVS